MTRSPYITTGPVRKPHLAACVGFHSGSRCFVESERASGWRRNIAEPLVFPNEAALADRVAERVRAQTLGNKI